MTLSIAGFAEKHPLFAGASTNDLLAFLAAILASQPGATGAYAVAVAATDNSDFVAAAQAGAQAQDDAKAEAEEATAKIHAAQARARAAHTQAKAQGKTEDEIRALCNAAFFQEPAAQPDPE